MAALAITTQTVALAQQNDQRLNRAITDAAYFRKAVKSAPDFRDLLSRRKKAVKTFCAIPTDALQPITIKAFATAEQRAGTRHVIIREHQYLNDSGYNNGRPVNGGSNHNTPPPPPPAHNSGNYGGYSGGGYIPGYADMYPGKRPPIPTVRNYSRYEAYERTNAAGIVVNTLFTSKMEAYDYIARLLRARYYNVASYGNNYDWIRSEVSFIPTPFDWTNPMTHNQFAMYFKITRVFGRVKVTITAQWRESVLSDRFSTLRFQPSNAYSTYYAWNVLEDIADNIPHTGVSYRTADLL